MPSCTTSLVAAVAVVSLSASASRNITCGDSSRKLEERRPVKCLCCEDFGDAKSRARRAAPPDRRRRELLQLAPDGGCDPDGVREPHGDRGCAAVIARCMSGFCEAPTAAAAPSRGAPAVRVQQRVWRFDSGAASRGGAKHPVGARGLSGQLRRLAADGECEPDGPREPDGDRGCDASIGAGNSGFCECYWDEGEGEGARGRLRPRAVHAPPRAPSSTRPQRRARPPEGGRARVAAATCARPPTAAARRDPPPPTPARRRRATRRRGGCGACRGARVALGARARAWRRSRRRTRRRRRSGGRRRRRRWRTPRARSG